MLDVSLSEIVMVASLFVWSYGFARTGLILRPPVSRENMMQHMQEAYCIIGNDGEIVDCNEQFSKICQSSNYSLVGSQARESLPDELALELDAQEFSDRKIALSAGKSDMNFAASLMFLSESHNSPATLLTLRDETEEHKIRETLEEKEEELAAAYRQIEEMTLIDSLTGLLNWEGLVVEFEKPDQATNSNTREQNRGTADLEDLVGSAASVSGSSARGIILVDIDHFSEINESHGYAIGDAVLVELARAMEATCRKTDKIARVAGEEFVLLAKHTDRRRLESAARRLQKHIRHTRVHLANNVTLQVTASIGATEVRSGQSLEQAILSASVLLKQAKQHGRDRVEIAEIENLISLPHKPGE